MAIDLSLGVPERGGLWLRRSLVWMWAVALLLGCGSQHPPGPPIVEPTPGQRTPYIIGVTDVVQIAVWKNGELGVVVPVRSDGKISVPLLDDVQAEGLTAEELKEVITQELSEYVTAPDVTVIVTEMNSRTAMLMGGVASTGPVNLAQQTRLLEAIALRGGFSTFARKNSVRILRQTDGGIVEYEFDYDDYISGKAPGTNIVLEPGDHVVIPE